MYRAEFTKCVIKHIEMNKLNKYSGERRGVCCTNSDVTGFQLNPFKLF